MKTIDAQQLAGILGAPVAAGDPAAQVTAGVSIDTRTIEAGAAFFALRGENFDGDQFAMQALEAGAAVVVVAKWQGEVPAGAAVIVVEDPLVSLQKLACWWRRQLDIEVVAVTGSNGKTSTKDFIASVLEQKFKVCSTMKNFNNHIGVPLSVLSATEQCQAAVWEMGMNHSGEIAPLCQIAQPKFGVITNIGSAHIEHLGSRDAIAEEKGMLARALPADGVLIIPAICEYHAYLRDRTKAAIVPVGNGRGLVRAQQPVLNDRGSVFELVVEGVGNVEVRLPVPGRHMINNALLAAAVGWKLGLSLEQIAAGLASARVASGRLRRFRSGGVEVIDDTYNANPESMAAAIDTLTDMPAAAGARRIAVLGRMAELGSIAAEAHLKVGELAADRGLDVVAVGEGAEGIAEGAGGAPHFRTDDEAADWLRREVRAGDLVLFKGSRAAAIENVMNSVFPQD